MRALSKKYYICTYSLNLSSELFSNNGIPLRNKIMKVVKIGLSIAIHSMP